MDIPIKTDKDYPSRNEFCGFIIQQQRDSGGLQLEKEDISITNIIPLSEEQYTTYKS